MATHANFDGKTTAQEVADTFSAQIEGRTVVVTGPSPGGIGAETARAIATKGPKLLVLAGRDIPKLEAAQADILRETSSAAVSLIMIDLSSLASVRSGAEAIIDACKGRLDVLINNAGIMATPYGVTSDGLERQFGTNYVGPWLLTNLLLPSLLSTPSPRVVFVSSMGHLSSPIRWDDLSFERGYNNLLAYGQSKTAGILNAVALSSRGVVALSLHPGGIQTNLMRHLTKEDLAGPLGTFFDADGKGRPECNWKTIEEGASTTLVAAFDPALAKANGAFLDDCQVTDVASGNMQAADALSDKARVADYAVDKGEAERLWKLTEEIVGQKF